jgi:hypothetical protein
METYWGIPTEEITPADFWRFSWQHRKDLLRYLQWADRMSRGA